MSRPLGDLRGRYSSVQPGGNGRVPQVVGAPGEQGRRFLAGERRSAGLMEDLKVGPVIEDAAVGTGEDAPVRELLAVGPTTRNALATIFV